MSAEIHFDGARVTNNDAPYNDKFGDAASLNDAVDKAREAHREAGGAPADVDNEDVVIIANGENLWAIWEEYAKPQGISWEEFLNNNMHLKNPTNLAGADQAGWEDWWLVHEGDVVFIPDTPQETADRYAGDIETIREQGGTADALERRINETVDQLKTDLSSMTPDEREEATKAILSKDNISDEYKKIAVVAYLETFEDGSAEQVDAARQLLNDPELSGPNRGIIESAAEQVGIDLSD